MHVHILVGQMHFQCIIQAQCTKHNRCTHADFLLCTAAAAFVVVAICMLCWKPGWKIEHAHHAQAYIIQGGSCKHMHLEHLRMHWHRF